MTKIPWWIHVIVGSIMMISSKIVNHKTNSNSLIFFWYVGILFIIWGVIRVIIKFIVNKKMKSDVKKHSKHHPQNYDPTTIIKKDNFEKGAHQIKSTQQKDYVQHATVVSCPACGTTHDDYAHYCMKCGTKIKK